jgi:hypothetical protein
VPTKEIYSDSCEYHKSMTEEFEGKVLCDFDLASNEFAWVNETTQHLLSKGVYGDEQ